MLIENIVKHNKARLERIISHRQDMAKFKEREEQQRRARVRDIRSLVLIRREHSGRRDNSRILLLQAQIGQEGAHRHQGQDQGADCARR